MVSMGKKKIIRGIKLWKDFKFFVRTLAVRKFHLGWESRNIFFTNQKKSNKKSGIRRFTIKFLFVQTLIR